MRMNDFCSATLSERSLDLHRLCQSRCMPCRPQDSGCLAARLTKTRWRAGVRMTRSRDGPSAAADSKTDTSVAVTVQALVHLQAAEASSCDRNRRGMSTIRSQASALRALSTQRQHVRETPRKPDNSLEFYGMVVTPVLYQLLESHVSTVGSLACTTFSPKKRPRCEISVEATETSRYFQDWSSDCHPQSLPALEAWLSLRSFAARARSCSSHTSDANACAEHDGSEGSSRKATS
jgi:hypothetical protein